MFLSPREDYVNNIHLSILNKVSGLLSNNFLIPCIVLYCIVFPVVYCILVERFCI